MRGLLKVVTGQNNDDVAALAAEIAAEKTKAAAACEEIENLQAARCTAESFERARELDEVIARARWIVEHADAVIPSLEGRLSILKAERQADGIVRHYKAAERAYRKLRAAVDAAAAAQVDAIAARNAAIAELGDAIVQRSIPAVAFGGMVMPDLVKLWTDELDRVFRSPAPNLSAPINPASTATYQRPRESDFGLGWTRKRQPEPASEPEPPKTPERRPLRRDASPGAGERQVAILRPGIELPDGVQGIVGDIVTLPEERAQAMVRGGAAEFFEA